jgi:hypothetical protein
VIKVGQHEVRAPEHTNWGDNPVKCEQCDDKFILGRHRIYDPDDPILREQYLSKLKTILAQEHESKQPHQNAYNFGIL